MTLTIRRTLALLFAALFIVIAPLSVAYGRGYRFDTKTRHVRLTGVIFLAGWPNRARVVIDEGTPKNVSFPTTLRGLLPTTHTLTISAAGYTTQIFTLNVRSGKTTFATDVQLYRTNPFTTLRTGLPTQAVLSPDGLAVAWLNGKNLNLADPTGLKVLDVGIEPENLKWTEDSENLLLLSATNITLMVVSKAGVRRDSTYIMPAGDRPKIDQLLNGRMKYNAVQHIPGGSSWLLAYDSSAWVLQASGDLTLATRWGLPIVNAVHLGHSSLATVRQTEILVRNLANAQTALYDLPGIVQAVAGTHEGEINLLMADGDLLQWKRGSFF